MRLSKNALNYFTENVLKLNTIKLLRDSLNKNPVNQNAVILRFKWYTWFKHEVIYMQFIKICHFERFLLASSRFHRFLISYASFTEHKNAPNKNRRNIKLAKLVTFVWIIKTDFKLKLLCWYNWSNREKVEPSRIKKLLIPYIKIFYPQLQKSLFLLGFREISWQDQGIQ